MATKIRCAVLFIILHSISYECLSQHKWEAGIHAGAYIYQGDLTPHRVGSVETLRPGIGVFGARVLNPSFTARLQFNYAALAGNESVYPLPGWRKHRNFSFNASVKELTLQVHWNGFAGNNNERRYEPYVFGGAGVAAVNISRNYSRYDAAYFGEQSDLHGRLAIDAATPTPRAVAVFPAGAGVRYNLSEKIAINLEGSYRFMRTDYLDGFSVAANPGFGDHYSSITIGAAYKFAGREKTGCPAVN